MKIRTAKKPLSDETVELQIINDNDEQLYLQTLAIWKNLLSKVDRGDYDPDRTPQAFTYLVNAGAKRAKAEFGGSYQKNDRDNLAGYYADEFEIENSIGTKIGDSSSPSGENPLRRGSDGARLRGASLAAAESAAAACSVGKPKAAGRAEESRRRTAIQDLKDHWGRALKAERASDALAELEDDLDRSSLVRVRPGRLASSERGVLSGHAGHKASANPRRGARARQERHLHETRRIRLGDT
jgi:hypothetical protein